MFRLSWDIVTIGLSVADLVSWYLVRHFPLSLCPSAYLNICSANVAYFRRWNANQSSIILFHFHFEIRNSQQWLQIKLWDMVIVHRIFHGPIHSRVFLCQDSGLDLQFFYSIWTLSTRTVRAISRKVGKYILEIFELAVWNVKAALSLVMCVRCYPWGICCSKRTTTKGLSTMAYSTYIYLTLYT